MKRQSQIEWHLRQAELNLARAKENAGYPQSARSWLAGARWHYEQAGMRQHATACKIIGGYL